MSPVSCRREPETVRAAWSGDWPAGCSEDLRRHVASCAVCKEAVALAAAFRDDRDTVAHGARIPAAGLVWWRAQLRARREAARAAETPVALAHGVAVAAGLAAAVAVALALLPAARSVFASLASALPSGSDLVAALPSPAIGVPETFSWNLFAQPAILVVLAATALLAPVAIYLAFAKE